MDIYSAIKIESSSIYHKLHFIDDAIVQNFKKCTAQSISINEIEDPSYVLDQILLSENKNYFIRNAFFVLEDNNVFMTSKDVNDFIEYYNVNMRNVEIVKVFEGDIKRPCYIDSYSYRGC